MVLYCKRPSGKREEIRVDALEPEGERKEIRQDTERKKRSRKNKKGFEEWHHGSSVCLY